MPGTNSSLEGRFVWLHGVKDFSLRCAGAIAGVQNKAGYIMVAVGVIGRPAPPHGGLETENRHTGQQEHARRNLFGLTRP